MFSAKNPRSERELELITMYQYRRQLPPNVRLRVTREYQSHRPFRFLAALALLMLLIVAALVDGMGWADTMKDRLLWANLLTIGLAGVAGSVMYDARHGVRLGRVAALVLSVGLVTAFAAVLLIL